MSCQLAHKRYSDSPSQETPHHSHTGTLSFQPQIRLAAANVSQFRIAFLCFSSRAVVSPVKAIWTGGCDRGGTSMQANMRAQLVASFLLTLPQATGGGHCCEQKHGDTSAARCVQRHECTRLAPQRRGRSRCLAWQAAAASRGPGRPCTGLRLRGCSPSAFGTAPSALEAGAGLPSVREHLGTALSGS